MEERSNNCVQAPANENSNRPLNELKGKPDNAEQDASSGGVVPFDEISNKALEKLKQDAVSEAVDVAQDHNESAQEPANENSHITPTKTSDSVIKLAQHGDCNEQQPEGTSSASASVPFDVVSANVEQDSYTQVPAALKSSIKHIDALAAEEQDDNSAPQKATDENSVRALNAFKDKLVAAKKEKFFILLVGRTGVGKSSTINSLMGQNVAAVGDFEPTTMEVHIFENELHGIQFSTIDTPGLCDDLEETGNDYIYLNLIRSKIPRFDVMWFVTRLDETRVTSDEKRGIKLISDAFGKRAWEHSIIVFTFSGNVSPQAFENVATKRAELIRKEIERYSNGTITRQIPFTCVDNMNPKLPSGKLWLGELFTVVFERISEKGLLPFIMATAEFLRPVAPIRRYRPDAEDYSDPRGSVGGGHRIILDEEQGGRMKRRMVNASVIPASAATGAAIGSVAGPVGTVVGGAVGAAIGLAVWLFS